MTYIKEHVTAGLTQVVFPTHFNPNNFFFILLQISLLFRRSPTLTVRVFQIFVFNKRTPQFPIQVRNVYLPTLYNSLVLSVRVLQASFKKSLFSSSRFLLVQPSFTSPCFNSPFHSILFLPSYYTMTSPRSQYPIFSSSGSRSLSISFRSLLLIAISAI